VSPQQLLGGNGPPTLRRNFWRYLTPQARSSTRLDELVGGSLQIAVQITPNTGIFAFAARTNSFHSANPLIGSIGIMPSIKISNQTTAPNALTGLKFSKLARAALISLWVSAVTVTDTVSLSVGDREVLFNANPNIEIANDVVDVSRDQILFAEPAEAGEDLFMPVTATTNVHLLVLIDEV